jgi:hypothetical protein
VGACSTARPLVRIKTAAFEEVMSGKLIEAVDTLALVMGRANLVVHRSDCVVLRMVD